MILSRWENSIQTGNFAHIGITSRKILQHISMAVKIDKRN